VIRDSYYHSPAAADAWRAGLRDEKRRGDDPLPRQCRNVRRVSTSSAGLESIPPWRTAAPNRVRTGFRSYIDRAPDLGDPQDRVLRPLQKRTAGGHQRDIEPLVNITRLLGRVIPIRIDDNGSVAVNAATKEVGKILVGDDQRAKCQALRGRQAYTRRS